MTISSRDSGVALILAMLFEVLLYLLVVALLQLVPMELTSARRDQVRTQSYFFSNAMVQATMAWLCHAEDTTGDPGPETLYEVMDGFPNGVVFVDGNIGKVPLIDTEMAGGSAVNRDYDTRPGWGRLYSYGSYVVGQDRIWGDNGGRGWMPTFRHDHQLASSPPPFYPTRSDYKLQAYQEIQGP